MVRERFCYLSPEKWTGMRVQYTDVVPLWEQQRKLTPNHFRVLADFLQLHVPPKNFDIATEGSPAVKWPSNGPSVENDSAKLGLRQTLARAESRRSRVIRPRPPSSSQPSGVRTARLGYLLL